MSAVKNLRAMFEQKGDTSPPDRGRSPGIPHGSGSNSPARPLSKVRTSFIAIEKDGRIGLQRGASQDSISAVRKLSGDSHVTTPTTATEKSNPFDALTKSPAKAPLQTQPVVESPRVISESKDAEQPAQEPQGPKLGSPLFVATEPKQPEVNSAEREASPPSASPSAATTPAVEVTNGTGSVKEAPKVAARASSKPAPHTRRAAPRPLAAASASRATSKPEKSPTNSRGPRTPVTTSTHHAATKKTPEKKAQPPENPATPRTTTTPKAAGPSSIRKPPPLQASPASTGFVKPKVKSPTRPIKLPPGLTTHTASSGSKVNVPRQSLSRASSTALPADLHGRPASRASGSTAGSAGNAPAPVRGLRRQSSTINRPRPSLGPPPKQPARDHPPTKREKEVDQGFLARMMRPTASSASKTTGRVHTSPPRKSAAAQKKVTTAKPVRRVVSRAAGAASSSAHSQTSTAKAADAEMSKTAEGEAIPAAEAGPKSAAQEAEPTVGQSETVEEVSAVIEDPPADEPEPNAATAAEASVSDGSDGKVGAAVSEANAETAKTEEKEEVPETTAA